MISSDTRWWELKLWSCGEWWRQQVPVEYHRVSTQLCHVISHNTALPWDAGNSYGKNVEDCKMNYSRKTKIFLYFSWYLLLVLWRCDFHWGGSWLAEIISLPELWLIYCCQYWNSLHAGQSRVWTHVRTWDFIFSIPVYTSLLCNQYCGCFSGGKPATVWHSPPTSI